MNRKICIFSFLQLLGKDSLDIDISIDGMLGREFAEVVMDYLKSKGLETQSIGIINMNPQQSKHLETATTKLYGQNIDFVNLRKETYDPNSRIPQMVDHFSDFFF